MRVHYFNLEGMKFMYTQESPAPKEGETIVLKQHGKPPSSAYVEFSVREIVHFLETAEIFALCVAQRDARRASERMNALLGAVK